MTEVEKVLSRLRDERGLGDRVTLAREAAATIERLLAQVAELESEVEAYAGDLKEAGYRD